MKGIILSFLLIFVGCTNVPKRVWKEIDSEKPNILNIQAGDIILKKREANLLGLFGHTGVMKTDRLVVDYPKFGESIKVVDIEYWLEENRKFIVLRYLGMNEEFKERFIENLNEYITLNRPYEINFDPKSEKGFYCSQFIWYIYYKTAKELGMPLKEDKNILFLPYDFVNSKEFYIVF